VVRPLVWFDASTNIWSSSHLEVIQPWQRPRCSASLHYFLIPWSVQTMSDCGCNRAALWLLYTYVVWPPTDRESTHTFSRLFNLSIFVQASSNRPSNQVNLEQCMLWNRPFGPLGIAIPIEWLGLWAPVLRTNVSCGRPTTESTPTTELFRPSRFCIPDQVQT